MKDGLNGKHHVLLEVTLVALAAQSPMPFDSPASFLVLGRFWSEQIPRRSVGQHSTKTRLNPLTTWSAAAAAQLLLQATDLRF
jgi:hypothetical protein